MRTLITLMLCLIGSTGVVSEVGSNEATIERLTWLVGTWQRTGLTEDRSGEERWWQDSAGGLTGVGTARRGEQVVFEEQLRIAVEHGRLVYIADVSDNAAPVHFQLVEIDDDGFVFENPDHDFPQRIAYRRDGDELLARVSAGERALEFRFVRQH